MVQGHLGLENLSISLSRSIARPKKKVSFSLGFVLCTYGKNVPNGLDLDNLTWTILPSKKPIILCISTKSYCLVQENTVGGPIPGRMSLQQGRGVPRPVCAAWMQKAVDEGSEKLQV